jgi:hypothetical protein
MRLIELNAEIELDPELDIESLLFLGSSKKTLFC